MEKPITILIAANHGLVAKAWQFIFGLHSRVNAIVGCHELESLLFRVKTLRPDIIMLDIDMKRMQEMNVVPCFEKVSPGTRVLGISMYTYPDVSDTLIRAGVSGYLTKSCSIKHLFEAITEIKEGRKYLCAELKKFSSQFCDDNIQRGLSLLSLREMDVIAGISSGYSLKEIAKEFKVPYRTIKRHHELILEKLGMDSDLELIEYLASPAL